MAVVIFGINLHHIHVFSNAKLVLLLHYYS